MKQKFSKKAVVFFTFTLMFTLLLTNKVTIAQTDSVVVYKSPTCGCCNKWVKHMKENGFKVTTHDRKDLQPIKQSMGVPNQLRSCHTAKVGNYIIEGHVPADLVTKMLKEKPAIIGLSVPGMVMGSPGMEGHRKAPYQVVSFDEKKQFKVYANR